MNGIDFMAFTGGDLAGKLRLAREAAGLSTRDVEKKLRGVLGVSHATIANYERGKTQPPLALVAALASVYGRPVNWFLDRGAVLTGIRYRALKSKVPEREKHRYEMESLRWIQAFVRIEMHLGQDANETLRLPVWTPSHTSRSFAEATREALGLGTLDPIPSVIDALGRFGILVMEVPTESRIDGFAAYYGKTPVVVLNPACSNDRTRLNAAHELFHILIGHCAGTSASSNERGDAIDRVDEDQAFACARTFLLPHEQLKEAFRGESFVKLVKFKETYGISLAAMIYAAQREGILAERKARGLWIELAKRGWKVNEPGCVRPDRATAFEELLDGAITTGTLSWAEAAKVTGIREEELRSRLQLAMGIASDAAPRKGGSNLGEPDVVLRGPRLAD